MTNDCPALHARHHDKGYPFGNRVPVKVRMLRCVRPDWPMIFARDPNEPVRVAEVDVTYPAWTNSYGAVAAVFPDGKKLGLRPDEFEIVEWHLLDDGAA